MYSTLNESARIILYGETMNRWWSKFERKFGLKREYTASLILCFLVIYLAKGPGNGFACNLIGFLYPAYASILSADPQFNIDKRRWTNYWIVYVWIILLENLLPICSAIIPLYWLAKSFLLVCFMLLSNDHWIHVRLIAIFKIFFSLFIDTKKHLRINPPTSNIQLQFRKTDGHGAVTNFQANNEGYINLKVLKDGIYEVEAYALGITPSLKLHKFSLEINGDELSSTYIDLQATNLHATFKRRDKVFDKAQVSGTFINKQGEHYHIQGETDSIGVITISFPEGIIENFSAKKANIVIQHTTKLTILPPIATLAHVMRKPKYVIIDVESTSFTDSVNLNQNNSRIVVLGDVSVSMESGTRMDILRQSFREILQKSQSSGWKISFASWTVNVEWCSDGWIKPDQIKMVETWINNRSTSMGNDMRNAIEDCMNRLPDVTDVYVMCDGDVSPFTIHPGQNCWSTFRRQYPDTKFHFIALGSEASHGKMELMAIIGDGTFTLTLDSKNEDI